MKYLSFLLCLSVLLASRANGAQHALLVGISEYTYQPGMHLDGPRYDVEALQKLLFNKYGFPEKNIKILVDSQATRHNILAAIDRLQHTSRAGDKIFIYFSGHGTSALDRANRLPLPHASGAFIAADFRSGPGDTMKDIMDRLLVGKRDLRPRLSRLEQGRQLFVAFDSCFSGNAVRGVNLLPSADPTGQTLPTRYHKLQLPTRSGAGDLDDLDEIGGFEASSGDDSYPYKNTFYLGAAAEHEKANDIGSKQLQLIPTYDGKPHGAFTNALLEVLGNPQKADSNNDGLLQQGEIYRSVKNKVQQDFPHTPHALPKNCELAESLKEKTFFRAIGKRPEPPPAPQKKRFRVKVDSLFSQLTQEVKRAPELELVQGKADVYVRERSGGAELLLSNGRPLCSFKRVDEAEIFNRLIQQVVVNDVIALNYPGQKFHVNLELLQSHGSVVKEGETLGFSISSDKRGYLLFINVDSTGMVNVIYPAYPEELQPTGGEGLCLRLEGIGEVTAPFGTEYLKGFIFQKKPQNLENIMGKSIAPGTPEFNILTGIIGLNSKGLLRDRAQDTLRLTSYPEKRGR